MIMRNWCMASKNLFTIVRNCFSRNYTVIESMFNKNQERRFSQNQSLPLLDNRHMTELISRMTFTQEKRKKERKKT